MALLQTIETIERKYITDSSLSVKNNKDFFQDYIIRNLGGSKLPDFLKIGNLKKESGLVFPALIPLSEIKGLAFELNDSNREEVNLTLQSIALQLIQQLDHRYFEFTIIDPKKMGTNFKYLRRLSKKYIKELVYDDEAIKSCINSNFNKSISIINECTTHYDSLEEYNQESGNIQPFRFFFIADFPYGFKDSMDKLVTLIHNNQESGAYFFMTYDPSVKLGMHQEKVAQILEQVCILQEFGNPINDNYRFSNFKYDHLFNKEFTLGLDRSDINPDKINDSVSEIMSLESSNTVIDSKDGVRIPIGKLSGQTFYFTFGHETTNYNAIIGGQSGKGKTVLLNNIIAKGIDTYSPVELQFMILDCGGVGFQEFKESNHLKHFLCSSNVEQCIEFIKLLEEEFSKREELFRTEMVAELRDYNKKATIPLPRIIGIIDEFHVLFTGTSRNTDFVEKIIVEKIIRIGRKFGLHLILSTQSLGGGVRKSILDNIPLRIALGMTSDQSANFLGLQNDAAANLERGVAVYNGDNGNKKQNKVFSVNFIDTETVHRIIKESNNKY